MTETAKTEAIETYRARRHELIAEAREAEQTLRPELAAELRHAAHALLLAIVDEQKREMPYRYDPHDR